MSELLLEILSEEIPARMQTTAAAELERLVVAGLKAQNLCFKNAQAYATPRRLVLFIDGLPTRQLARHEMRRGPSIDSPDKAVQGFAKSVGIKVKDLETEKTKKGNYYVACVKVGGLAISEIIATIVREAVWVFPWSVSMTWGENPNFSWVRPLQSILCILDGKTVKFDIGGIEKSGIIRKESNGISPHGLTSGNYTVGHRFLAPNRIKIKSFADYKMKLREAKVIFDADERHEFIENELNRKAESAGLSVKKDDTLLAEVTGLIEWPVVLLGKIEERFMSLPDEVMTTVMRRHQKYFVFMHDDGTLAPYFAFVANIDPTDGGANIVIGNERVLAARLADARFFLDQDCKNTLEGRTPELEGLVYHAKLGSIADKVSRLRALIHLLAGYVPGVKIDAGERAALLAKNDLATGMVGEFPELQGTMGRYYALQEGVSLEVAEALAEHYSPLGPSDRCPNAPVSVVLALADKIDTLAGFWSIDEKPTGSKDPYALRRAALGVIRLIVENQLRVPLQSVLVEALIPFFSNFSQKRQLLGENLLAFFINRLKVHLRGRGVRHDLINAVVAIDSEDDLLRLLNRVDALSLFLDTDDGKNLLAAYRRATNILQIEEKKDGVIYNAIYDTGAFKLDQEKALGAAMVASKIEIDQALSKEDFSTAMLILARLHMPIDEFFNNVTVNVNDAALRENRLLLMAQIRSTMFAVADFSQIEG